MTVGLIHPRVFISTALGTEREPDEVEAVLRHERLTSCSVIR